MRSLLQLPSGSVRELLALSLWQRSAASAGMNENLARP